LIFLPLSPYATNAFQQVSYAKFYLESNDANENIKLEINPCSGTGLSEYTNFIKFISFLNLIHS